MFTKLPTIQHSVGTHGPKDECAEYCCALCSGRQNEAVAHVDRHGEALTTVVCVRCGLVSHEHIPTDDELTKFYSDEYRREYNGEISPSPKRVVREWRRGRERFELIRPFLRAADVVFEVGAGIGCNLKPFEFEGHSTSGIEPGGGFADFSREQMRCRIKTAVLEDLPVRAEFDVVLLVHVLEHLPDPRRAFTTIRRMLRPHGRLYVEVPNLAAPHAAPGKMFHFAHLFNYTPRTLTMLANACGFDVTHRLSSERDRNLRVWLTCREGTNWEVDPRGYAETRDALQRYSSLTYHCRLSYLRERVYELTDNVRQWWARKRKYAEILQECARREPRAARDIIQAPAA